MERLGRIRALAQTSATRDSRHSQGRGGDGAPRRRSNEMCPYCPVPIETSSEANEIPPFEHCPVRSSGLFFLQYVKWLAASRTPTGSRGRTSSSVFGYDPTSDLYSANADIVTA